MKIQKINEFVKMNEEYDFKQRREQYAKFVETLGEPITDIHEIERCFENVANMQTPKYWYWADEALGKCNAQQKNILSEFYRCVISEDTPITNKLAESIVKIVENEIIKDVHTCDDNYYECSKYDADTYMDDYVMREEHTFQIRNAEIDVSFEDYKFQDGSVYKKGIHIVSMWAHPDPTVDREVCTPFIDKCIDKCVDNIYHAVEDECIDREPRYADDYDY